MRTRCSAHRDNRLAGSLGALAAIVSALSLSPAGAQSGHPFEVCANVAAHRAAGMAACSHVIESGRLKKAELAAAYFNRGVGAAKAGEFENAIGDYSRAIELDPDRARFFNGRGHAYDMKDDSAHALADFDRAIALNPKFAPALGNRAQALLKANEPDKAIADANAAIRIAAEYGPAYRTRGLAYALKGQWDKALADLDKAVGLDPRDAAAIFNRGLAHGRKGDRMRALADFRAALAAAPWHRDARLWRAQLTAALQAKAGRKTAADSPVPVPRSRPPGGKIARPTQARAAMSPSAAPGSHFSPAGSAPSSASAPSTDGAADFGGTR